MLKSKRFNNDAETKIFLDYNLGKLPRHWRDNVIEKYNDMVKKQGQRLANTYLHDLTEPLENLLNIAADDDDLKNLSKEVAFKVREVVGKKGTMLANLDYMNELCLAWSVRYPVEHDYNQCVARLCDDTWWLRNLRNAHARAREVAAINAGIVHKKADLYCSDDTLERRGQQIRRNAETLANINLESESGQRMSLADIAKTGMANADNRRAELMTRISGFEELSIKYGHKAEFVTLTCPSRMHAVTKDGKANAKYDGTKPDKAQRYLVECWARARAQLARDGVKFYGLRVAEPHHDATPHWHMILFYDGKQKTRIDLRAGITKYFIADSRQEIWNDISPRVKFVAINPLKGSAAGYVAKYVAKNIGGIEGEKSDESDEDSTSVAGRVEAWAATWRIRQFQQIGGHSVTVWRELRRITCEVAFKASDRIFGAWQTAQKTIEAKASFARFIESMGGIVTKPKESVIKIDDDYLTKRGKYGETIVRVIKGVRERWGRHVAANNREEWHKV
jgi:flagellar biosynthesis/type III secretory pathway chaperone